MSWVEFFFDLSQFELKNFYNSNSTQINSIFQVEYELALNSAQINSFGALAQKDLSEMDFLRQELAQIRENVEIKNIDLDMKEDKIDEKMDELMWLRDELSTIRMELIDKKEELMQIKDNLFSTQKALTKKDSLLQKANAYLVKQIPKTYGDSEVYGDISRLEKNNSITSSGTMILFDRIILHKKIIYVISHNSAISNHKIT
ncbi:hypothetical protein GLOIN_2v1827941 [Rhizophagus clarus]|uniref:Uncharacterized protein n=1 Tax=Rhizophagus clarus TaxID=94130 RepID=A0A8H3L0H5_9GLOM|nr:hypothetical protein GLOIN_2v1827941 [Rhizophagus clarus]